MGKQPRPRTYREKARRQFVAFVKQKSRTRNKIRKANRQQLGYLKRNLQAIDRLLENPDALPLTELSHREYKNLLVCRELYRQQQQMYVQRTQRVDDRIVSISQPHVRPIKRGKAGRDTEFGAKLSVSVVDGFSFVDRMSWDNYNESLDLIGQIERYKDRFGCYPESLHVDKIYRTRENRAYCKERGIRMSGPPLGRKPQTVSREEKEQAQADEAIRNQVEGKFGQGKRRFGLGRVMAKLAKTSAAQIVLTFLVMNLERALEWLFLRWLGSAGARSPTSPANTTARPTTDTAGVGTKSARPIYSGRQDRRDCQRNWQLPAIAVRTLCQPPPHRSIHEDYLIGSLPWVKRRELCTHIHRFADNMVLSGTDPVHAQKRRFPSVEPLSSTDSACGNHPHLFACVVGTMGSSDSPRRTHLVSSTVGNVH